MDFNSVCRTCLTTENLQFFQHYDEKSFSGMFYTLTGIQIRPNDGLPQKLCSVCIKSLNQSLKFRKQCKYIEGLLTKIKRQIETESSTKIELVKIADYIKEFRTNGNIEGEKLETDLEESFELTPLWSLVEELNVNGDINENEHVDDDDGDNKPLKDFIKGKYIEVVNNDDIESNDEAGNGVSHSESTNEPPSRRRRRKVTNKNNEAIVEHTKLENRRKSIKENCVVCRRELSKRSMGAHMAKVHPEVDTRRRKCDLCDNYVLVERLELHVGKMHGENFTCLYCKTDHGSRDKLLVHVSTCLARSRRKSDSSRVPSECDVCHKRMQRGSLKLHKAVKHAGLRPVCQHCNRPFSNKFRLNEHLRAKHGYEKYKCSYCGFRTASNMALQNHERRHRGEKPYVCEQCGVNFHAAYLLAQHRQSHRTEKPVKCDQCTASFKANNSLHVHKLTCHSTTKFKCSMCPKTYSCRQYAVKHLRQSHLYTGPVARLVEMVAPPSELDEGNT